MDTLISRYQWAVSSSYSMDVYETKEKALKVLKAKQDLSDAMERDHVYKLYKINIEEICDAET